VSLKLASQVLQAAGHTIIQAEDAEQALAMLDSHMPDLVLTDIALPGMDGLELTRRLKADARYKHLTIVALTASAMRRDELRFMEAGCDAYIAKPIDTRNLPLQLTDVLARHKAAGGSA
jgi:two-component system cell cycle response regulator